MPSQKVETMNNITNYLSTNNNNQLHMLNLNLNLILNTKAYNWTIYNFFNI